MNVGRHKVAAQRSAFIHSRICSRNKNSETDRTLIRWIQKQTQNKIICNAASAS